MAKYISLDALVAKIRGYINNAETYLKYHHNRNDKSVYAFEQEKLAMCELLSSLDTLEVKEVDLDKEIKEEYLKYRHYGGRDNMLVILNEPQFNEIAKHFFELGLKASNPITAADRGTAEEIIISLKRVEEDYGINLTREIEWLRNKVKKGEDV
jgi:hypothetical protein